MYCTFDASIYFKTEYSASVAEVFQLNDVFFVFDNSVPPRCHMLCMYVATFRWPKDILGLAGEHN